MISTSTSSAWLHPALARTLRRMHPTPRVASVSAAGLTPHVISPPDWTAPRTGGVHFPPLQRAMGQRDRVHESRVRGACCPADGGLQAIDGGTQQMRAA